MVGIHGLVVLWGKLADGILSTVCQGGTDVSKLRKTLPWPTVGRQLGQGAFDRKAFAPKSLELANKKCLRRMAPCWKHMPRGFPSYVL